MACAALAGCGPAPQPTPTPAPTAEMSLTDKAAAEATSIVQRAQATAIVMRANATAAALTRAQPAESTPAAPDESATPAATRAASLSATPTAAAVSAKEQATTQEPAAEEAGGLEAVELVSVGFAADTGFIAVQFKAPKKVSDTWRDDNVYVLDEATGTKYNEIPMVPIVGPLFARPLHAGQLGYVMFKNAGGHGLKSGDLVTVVLGEFKREHVKVM